MKSAIHAAVLAPTLAALLMYTSSTAPTTTEPVAPELTPAADGTTATIASAVVLGLVVLATLARAARNYARGRNQADPGPVHARVER